MSSPAPVVVSVSQVNRRISMTLGEDKALKILRVKGEIANFTLSHKTGHLFFSLADRQSTLRCVMFSDEAEDLLDKISPRDGDEVIVTGSLVVYEAGGYYQLRASSLEMSGGGDMYADFMKLKQRLQDEGLFSQKRPLPEMPGTIAVITSPSGAVLRDVISVVLRRCPVVKLRLFPAQVQGAYAVDSIVKQLRTAQTSGADAILLCRGGGSAEDLSAFNDERLARAIYASAIPTVSAVGHETDFSISDFAADLRAATPTAAAELLTPDYSDIDAEFTRYEKRLRAIISRKADRIMNRLPDLSGDICRKAGRLLENKKRRLSHLEELIAAKNPYTIMSKGYAVFTDENGAVVKSASGIAVGGAGILRFADMSEISVRVESKQGKSE